MKQWGGITEAFTTCVDHAAHSVFYSLQVNCASSAPQSKCHFRHLSWVLILLFICLIPIKQIRKVRVDSGGKLIICFAFSVYAEVRMKTVHDETSESASVSFLCPCCDRVKVDLWKCCFPRLLHIWDLASANIYIWYVCIFFFPEEFFRLPSVRVSVSSAEEQETLFSCFAKGFSPKDYTFKWFKNNKEVTSKVYETNTPIQEDSKTPDGMLYSAASFLTVLSSEWTVENTVFTCQLKGRSEKNGPVYVNSSATYKVPEICKYSSFY